MENQFLLVPCSAALLAAEALQNLLRTTVRSVQAARSPVRIHRLVGWRLQLGLLAELPSSVPSLSLGNHAGRGFAVALRPGPEQLGPDDLSGHMDIQDARRKPSKMWTGQAFGVQLCCSGDNQVDV